MSRDDQLADLLVEWEEAIARGKPLSPETLCRDRTELLPDFRSLLGKVGVVNEALGPGIPIQDESPAPAKIEGSRYRPVRFHAKGGLGLVFAAKDAELNRIVALKCMQQLAARDPSAHGRFLREAEITGHLEHPGVVPVYGFGRDHDGSPYYAMRFIHGNTLGDAIDRFHGTSGLVIPSDPTERNVEFRRLIRSFVTVCETIAYAHSRGVIHRDVKPANIMLGPYGETLLLDWGLAKYVGHPEPAPVVVEVESATGGKDPTRLLEDGGTKESFGMGGELPPPGLGSVGPEPSRMESLDVPVRWVSSAGVVVGTVPYMSPEQARGEANLLGPASDVYSLGSTLFTLLTGQRAYTSASLNETLRKVSTGSFVPPRVIKPELPRPLDAICRKAMAFDPANRYADARDLAKDLERWLANEPVSAWREPFAVRARRWVKRHRVMVIVTLASASVAIATLVAALAEHARLLAEGDREKAEVARTEADEQRGKAIVARSEADEQRAKAVAASVQLAGTNRQLDVSLNDTKKAQEELAVLNYARTIDLASREYQANNVALARQYLAFCRQDLRGWEYYYVHRLCNPDLFALPNGSCDWVAEFSPDGTRLATVGSDGAVTVWDGLTGAKITELKPPKPIRTLSVTFTPDGSRIVVRAQRDGGETLWVGDVRTGTAVTEYTRSNKESLVAASPRGNRVLVREENGNSKVVDVATGKTTFTFPANETVEKAWFSPDGSHVATLGDPFKIIRVRNASSGEKLGELIGINHLLTQVWFSDDNRAVAVRDLDSLRLAGGDTWKLSARLPIKLQPLSLKPVSVRVSPDGKRAAVASERTILSVWSADDSAKPLLGPEENCPLWDVTPDVSRAVVGSTGGGVEVLDLREGKQVIARCRVSARVTSARLTPDGTRVVTEARVLQRSGEQAGVLQVWDAGTGQEILALPRFVEAERQPSRPNTLLIDSPSGPQFVNLTPDGRRLVVASESGTVEVWDTTTGALLVTRKGLPATRNKQSSFDVRLGPLGLKEAMEEPDHLVVSPDGDRVVTPLTGGGVAVWDVRFAGNARAFGKPTAASGFGAAPFDPDDTRVALVALPDGRKGLRLATVGSTAVSIIDLWTGRPPRILTPDPALKFWAVDVSPDGTRVATWEAWRAGQYVRVWDAATGRQLASDNTDFQVAPVFARFTADGKGLLAIYPTLRNLKADEEYPPARLVWWNALTCKLGERTEVVGSWERGNVDLAKSGDQMVLVTGGRKFGPFTLYDAATGKKLRELAWEAEPGASKFLANGPTKPTLSVDGARVAGILSGGQHAVIWDVSTGKELLRIGKEGEWVGSIRFSPDRKYVVTTGRYGTPPRVWDAATGKPLVTLIGHVQAVNWAEFSLDRTRIVTASDDRTVRVWDARTGYPLLTLSGHPDAVGKASFSPDGLAIISSSLKETRVWDTRTPVGAIAP